MTPYIYQHTVLKHDNIMIFQSEIFQIDVDRPIVDCFLSTITSIFLYSFKIKINK